MRCWYCGCRIRGKGHNQGNHHNNRVKAKSARRLMDKTVQGQVKLHQQMLATSSK